MSESLISSVLVSDVSELLTKKSDVSESLRSLTKNERCEQIAQVAHQKWTIHSECSEVAQVADQKYSNGWITRFLSESLICSFLGKKSDSLKKLMSEFPALCISTLSGWLQKLASCLGNPVQDKQTEFARSKIVKKIISLVLMMKSPTV